MKDCEAISTSVGNIFHPRLKKEIKPAKVCNNKKTVVNTT
jgi:hypothetical protein